MLIAVVGLVFVVALRVFVVGWVFAVGFDSLWVDVI